MTTLHWVRHGPTHEKTFTGWRDVPADLSDKAQIARLRAHLPGNAVVVSSDLTRCVATADAVTGGDHIRLPHHAGLREFNFGDWDGKHFSQVSQTHPDLSRAYWETPGDIAPPGGETWNQAAARINATVDALIAAHPGRDIIAVAHFGAILTQIQRALGCAPYAALGHSIDNLSVTTLVCGPVWRAQTINHLP